MLSAQEDTPDVIPFGHVDQLKHAQLIIRQEADALHVVADNIDASFADAVKLILRASGCVVVTGVGKAGLIGQKIVATMASTGTRARFLHPTEAVHGDLGCVSSGDVVLALSNSGGSEEVLRLLPALQKLDIPIVAITRDTQNNLAQAAEVVLSIGRHREAGALGLAPSVSTTAMLAMGDALALVLSRAKGFTESDFAIFHPAGSLGRKLTPVSEVMRRGSELRVAGETETVREVLIELRRPGRRSGAVLLADQSGRLSGIFTDSDLARLFEKRSDHLIDGPISDVMTRNPTTTGPETLLPEAIHLMSSRKISELPVVDQNGIPVGLIDITDVIECPVPDETEADGRCDQSLKVRSA